MALTVGLATAVALMSACGGGAEPQQPSTGTTGAKIGNSLTALMDRELAKKDVSPGVRQILERSRQRGTISAEDYEAAFANYAKCVKSAGVNEEYKKLSTGIYQVIPHYSTQSEAAGRADFDKSNGCGLEHLAAVEALYTLQVGNPDLLADSNEVARQCLVKAGVVKADFSTERFKELAEANFEGAPFDVGAPAFTQCLANAGMAVARKS